MNAYIKNYLGAKNTVMIGFALLAFNSIGLGLITHVSHANAYVWLSCLMRFMQGFGDNMINITGFCILTQVFRDEMMLYIGYAELAIGLGLGMGPMLG